MHQKNWQKTTALIHLDHLRHNFRLIRQRAGEKVLLCAAVKANAYGHGASQVARVLVEEGVEYLGVATWEEGLELRKARIKTPILVLGLLHPSAIQGALEADLSLVVTDLEYLKSVQESAEKGGCVAKVHIKTDVGMGRIGCLPSEALELTRKTVLSPWSILEGLCTHFPESDLGQEEPTRSQLGIFLSVLDQLQAAGFYPPLVHASNSGAITEITSERLNMVRPGISLYGYPPSPVLEGRLPLKPVMEVLSTLTFLKKVPEGCPISYGGTYRTKRETWIGTVAAGYGDGFSRRLTQGGRVLIRGQSYPIAGRICMDQFMVDLGPRLQVERWDTVTLFGPSPQGPNASEVATLTGTIPYEVTCQVSARVARVYVEDSPPKV